MAVTARRKRADIAAVAARAKVSPATVSRYFNHPDLVKADTRKRIQDACESLDYLRNRGANTLRGMRTGSVGLLVPTVHNAIFSEMIQAFAEHLSTRERTLLIGTHGYDLEAELRLLRSLLEHRIDGIALVGLEHLEATYELLAAQNVPAVTLWGYSETSRFPCVGPENADAGRLAAQHLLELGHTDIALLFPELDGNDRARARFQGAVDACRQAGVEISANRIRTTPYDTASAKIAGMDLLREDSPPTAAICGNDVIARGVVYAAQALGWRLPAQFSVVGIGDFAGSAEMEPGLTSVRMPAQQIGRLGAQALIDAVESGGDGSPARRRTDLTLVTRRSSGPVPHR